MKNNGFTLIEILLSIVLISIVVTALFPMFNQSFKSIFLAREKTEKINLAQDKINEFINKENPNQDQTLTFKDGDGNNFTLEVDKRIVSESITNSNRTVELNYYILYPTP